MMDEVRRRVVLIDLASAIDVNQWEGHYQSRVAGNMIYKSLCLMCNSDKKPTYADDLESLAYVMWELQVGAVPWEKESLIEKIIEKKKKLPKCPPLLLQLISYCRSLGSELPDYEKVKHIFLFCKRE
jgi:hypothetical protein